MNKIPIYFFPGMSSTSLIFENIKLDSALFDITYLEWLPINKQESLDDYVQRFILLIKHKNPVLIGVSFGGIIAQEIAKKITVRKTIIISSIRCNIEYPKLYKFAKRTKIYKLLPTKYVEFIFKLYCKINKKAKDRIPLYDKYLPIRDKEYLDWSIDKILNWQQSLPAKNVIHIQGDKDELFPIKNINNAIIVKGGTHAMIIIKYKWFNNNLQNLILEVNNEKND